jgi:DHA2 family multidrug resistance protein
MMLVGILSRKVQLRWLVAAGLITQVGSLLIMMGFTPNLTFHHAVWARIMQSVGMGCIFIPVTTLSYEGLKGSQTNSATVLLNICRNVGGSFGIAITNSWLARGIQTYHSQLGENINPYNPIAVETYENLRSSMGDTGALMSLDGLVNQQAAVMAFNHVFFLSAVVCAFVLLLIPILPKNDPHQGGAGGGLH